MSRYSAVPVWQLAMVKELARQPAPRRAVQERSLMKTKYDLTLTAAVLARFIDLLVVIQFLPNQSCFESLQRL